MLESFESSSSLNLELVDHYKTTSLLEFANLRGILSVIMSIIHYCLFFGFSLKYSVLR